MDILKGIERLTGTEQSYYRTLTEIMDKGVTTDDATEHDLLRRGHLEEYEQMMKLTESGFQLLNFLQQKMSGEAPPLVREA